MINLWDIRAEDATGVPPLEAGPTVPAVFFAAVSQRSDAVFMRSKRLGVWASTSWREAGTAVREAAAGLKALGVQPGQVVCILSHTRQECLLADLAVQSIGAISAAVVPGLAPDMAGICSGIGAVAVFVEDDAQLHALRTPAGTLPAGLKFIRFQQEAGAVQDVSATALPDWSGLRALGRAAATGSEDVDAAVARLSADAPAILSFSAGTTAVPAQSLHTHRSVLDACRALQERLRYSTEDARLSVLPWARSNERLLGVYLPILAGSRLNFTEGLDTVQENLREVAPTLLSATPRQLLKLRDEVLSAVMEAGRVPRAAFDWAMACGAEAAAQVLAGNSPAAGLKFRCTVSRLLILNNVRRFVGLDRCRQLVVVDAMLPAEVASWYLALGVPLVQTWGTSESLGIASVNMLPGFKPGMAGHALPLYVVSSDVSSGELLIAGAQAGGVTDRTGDLGHVEADGTINVLGRASERMSTAPGHDVPASRIQQLLRETPFIRDALVFSQGRQAPVALVLIAREKAEQYAQRIGISFSGFRGLTAAPEVRALVQATVDQVNTQLPAPVRIGGVHLIDRDMEPGDPELTPSHGLRRWVVESLYREHIGALDA